MELQYRRLPLGGGVAALYPGSSQVAMVVLELVEVKVKSDVLGIDK